MTRAVGYDLRPGWREPIMMYSFKCHKCGKQVVDYPHGYSEYLQCPICGAKEAK